jgi:hypothetical protein
MIARRSAGVVTRFASKGPDMTTREKASFADIVPVSHLEAVASAAPPVDQFIRGGDLDDRQRGGAGNDRIHGGGNDTLNGVGGSDALIGNTGNDSIIGVFLAGRSSMMSGIASGIALGVRASPNPTPLYLRLGANTWRVLVQKYLEPPRCALVQSLASIVRGRSP